MRSRTFLNVSLGILALAAAYHLGAQSATAQAGNQVTAVQTRSGLPGAPDLVATADGSVYHGTHGPFGENPFWTPVGHVGSSAPVVGIRHEGSNASGEYLSAYAANGDYFRSSDNGSSWQFQGNVFSSATPVQRESWGAVKARYRGEREPQDVKPSTGR